ncbi:OCIA domain-containing protein 1 [Octopus bimaculoides]|uniref:OCIA domain-containing protein 1 n=1 Tax=Octopus bimaculoides TaxID=37653 RepID=UPI0022E0C698|nr:OCIA domain-containing protein 1 [Octopus bimaculoides]
MPGHGGENHLVENRSPADWLGFKIPSFQQHSNHVCSTRAVTSQSAGLAGYILGKLSYQNECRKKILSLPNSKLAETLRQRFSGGSQPTTEFVPEVPMNTTLTTSDPKLFEDSNVFQSKAEPKEPLPTFSLGDQSNDAQNQEYKSYEDLRRQNRKSYTESQYSRWTKPPSSPPPSAPESRQEQDNIPIREPRSSPNNPVKSKNQYGDVWEEE